MTAPSCVIPLVSASEFFRGLPCCFFSFCILFSPLCFIGISRNKGLGDFPQQAYVFLTFCGTKYYACYFCCAVAHIFPPELISLLRLSMLRHRIWSYATSISAVLVGGHSRSRSCVMPSFIITLEIVIWYGAVIAQSGRQFDESEGCFFGCGVV